MSACEAGRSKPVRRAARAFVLVVCSIALITLTACSYRSFRAERLADRMQDPDVAPRKRFLAAEALRRLTPESEPYLGDLFFPIGLYDVPEEAIQRVAADGFNLIVNGGRDPLYLRRAEAAGLKVIPYIRHDHMAADVARVGRSPAVAAWYLQDEPDLNEMPPETYAELADLLRDEDPARPIYLTVWSPAHYERYVDEADIFAPNPYPIIHENPDLNDLRIVGAVLDAARRAAGDRPVWAILQAFHAEPVWPRQPAPEELRAMVFIALNHGASGVIYFSWKSGGRPIVEDEPLYAEILRTNGQLRALRAALLVPPERGSLHEPLPTEDPLTWAGLDYSIRRFGDARLFIVVNPDPKPVEITLPAGELGEGVLKPCFPGADAAGPLPADFPITLEFAPFEVRLYWIE